MSQSNDTFGEAEPYVCEARMYRSLVLTDFHMLRESKFGFARKMLYLCNVNHERQQAGGGHPM